MDDGTTAFWNFSIAVYKQPGVQEECLDLQERLGVDVNLLLFCAYAGALHGVKLDKADVASAAEAVGEWHADVVRSLRHARKALKPWTSRPQLHFGEAAGLLRVQVKRVELEAERIEHAILAQWMASREDTWRERRQTDPAGAVATNIKFLLDHYDTTGKNVGNRPPPQFMAAVISQVNR